MDLLETVGVSLVHRDDLRVGTSDGGDESTSLDQLSTQRRGDRLGRRRDDDGVERRPVGEATPAVTDDHVDVQVEGGEVPASGLAQPRLHLDGVDLGRQFREQRGLVARPRAHLEDAFVPAEVEEFEHAGDQGGLRRRLARGGPERTVLAGPAAVLDTHEPLPRYGLQRREHTLVGHARAACRGDESGRAGTGTHGPYRGALVVTQPPTFGPHVGTVRSELVTAAGAGHTGGAVTDVSTEDSSLRADPLPGGTRATLWFGLVAVTLYVAGWITAGAVRDGYRPTEQAISELFEIGAPWASRGLLTLGLALSGVAFLLLAPALHRALPGDGRSGPALVALAGVGTLGVLAAPCTAGCPGFGTTTTDTWHVITAGLGYGALASAPLAFAWRLRGPAPDLARWSAILGGVSVALFAVHLTGAVPAATGLQQRVFNTVADAWYVLIAVQLLRQGRRTTRV
jgi:hypothetical protein